MSPSVSLFIGDLSIGGAERVAVNLSKGLSDLGHDVEIVLLQAGGELFDELPDAVSVFELDSDRLRWSPLSLARYLHRFEPEVLISFMTAPNVIAILSNMLAGSPAQTIATEHNTQTMKQSTVTKRDTTLAAYVYRYADDIVGVSKGVADDVAKWAKIPSDRISAIYNPVIETKQIGKEWNVPSHPWFEHDIPIVITAGRHVEQKDHATLIRAFARLESSQDARLVILGEGPLTSEYENQIESLGISENVSFPGFVDNLYKYMYHADVFALSSAWEGLSLVLIESMACGTPVVTTDCPYGPAEVVANGEFGPLVPVGADEEMCSAIKSVMREPIPREKLQKRAEHFSIEHAAREYESLFSKV